MPYHIFCQPDLESLTAIAEVLPSVALAVVEKSNSNTYKTRQIVLDAVTTGLDPKQGHRIVEVACVELFNRKKTGRYFHHFINPEREVGEGTAVVCGLTPERLRNEPRFAEIAPALLEFINGAELIIHNAPFDVGFLNKEMELAGLPALSNYCPSVICTLKQARELHPGMRNSLNALCDRYRIDCPYRALDGAWLNTRLLAAVYLVMTEDQSVSVS